MIGGYFFVLSGLSAGAGLSASLRFADFLHFYEGLTQTLSGLSAEADFLNGGRTQTLSQLLRSCLGFLLLICLQKQAFDTASKQKTPSLS